MPPADEAPRDVRPLVLAAATWLTTGLAITGEMTLVAAAAGIVAATAGLAAWRRSWFWAAVAALACACVVSGGVRAAAVTAGPLADLVADGASADVQVRLSGAGRLWPATGNRDTFWLGSGVLQQVEARGGAWRSGAPVSVAVSGRAAEAWASVPLGSVVRASVRLGPADPGTAAWAELRARGSPSVVARPDPVSAAVTVLRRGLVDASAGLAPDARALVPALVVGDTSKMSEELRRHFVTTGLTHLTAVSGANLTLLLGFLRVVAVSAGVRGRWLTGIMVAGVAGFVALCLGEPSVVRAAAMGLVGLAALGHGGRGRQGLRLLSVAVVAVVLVEPPMARSVGFALSVLATFGLLWWAGPWADALARWLPRPVAEALAVPLAAQVATEPVVVGLADQVSVVAVLANLIAGPMVGPATVLGLVATLLAPVWPPGAAAAAWLAGWCAQAIAWVARLGEALPGAAVPWSAGPVGTAVVVGGCVVAVILVPRVLERWWLCGLLVLAVGLSLLRTPTPPGWPPAAWAVVVCDVGQGDATVINAGAGQAVVVDVGPDPGLLRACLGPLGVRSVPLVVLTHLHADHVGGLAAVAGLGVHSVVTSAVRSPPAADAAVTFVLPDAARHVAAPGDAWRVGEARVEVLAAPELGRDAARGEGESSAENDASLLVRAEAGGVRVLLAGDAEDAAQGTHARRGEAVLTDVFVVPHHGSGRHDPAFVAAARPSVATISVGKDNGYGHPAARTLRSVADAGVPVFRTDERGSIAVARRAEGTLIATTQR